MNAIDLRPYLRGCGYDASRLAFDVEVDSPRRIPLVAFAHSPHDSRSACVAVIDDVGEPQADVGACRSVGAPLVFASFNYQWQLWKQATERPQLIESIAPSELDNFFITYQASLAPDSVYRAKTWARFDNSYQLAFVDLGLMPLIEEEAGRSLSRLVERVVMGTKSRLGWQEISNEQGHWLFKATFWLLAGKILRDKKVRAFEGLELEDLDDVFARVANHYGASSRVSAGPAARARALRESAREISRFSNLALVTTEALAYLYENALITKATRIELGTHSTPAYLVDYITGKLRPWIKEIPIHERQVFEPACGQAAFLISALRLLGDLLPSGTNVNKRRAYLRKRLHGCDVDSFALEIALLGLTLSDVPNPNGWDLKRTDILELGILESCSARANIILANPPFRYASDMLERVVESMQAGAVFGVVLPQGLLHSKSARRLRQIISTKFEVNEICLFPDKVFHFSDAESAVILARHLGHHRSTVDAVSYKHIRESEIKEFRRTYKTTSQLTVRSSRFVSQTDWNFFIPDLEALWIFCSSYPRLADIAEVGQGFSFRSRKDPLLPKGATTETNIYSRGLTAGFARLRKSLRTHEQPDTTWFNLNSDVIASPRHGTVTGIPQVLLNYARVSRGPWRLKAFLDRKGRPVTSRFLVIRPRGDGWPIEALWAICNSPFANAYSYAFSGKRDVLAGLMRKMPVPNTNAQILRPLLERVHAYLLAMRQQETDILGSGVPSDELRALHWRIDAEVLRLYGLPPQLEKQLLDLFSGVERRGVPFRQNQYFPKDFSEPLTLSQLLAISADWDRTNERRTGLILKKVKGTISSIEQSELDVLQRLADARVRLLAPLPIKQMETIMEDLQRRGMWEGTDAIA